MCPHLLRIYVVQRTGIKLPHLIILWHDSNSKFRNSPISVSYLSFVEPEIPLFHCFVTFVSNLYNIRLRCRNISHSFRRRYVSLSLSASIYDLTIALETHMSGVYHSSCKCSPLLLTSVNIHDTRDNKWCCASCQTGALWLSDTVSPCASLSATFVQQLHMSNT